MKKLVIIVSLILIAALAAVACDKNPGPVVPAPEDTDAPAQVNTEAPADTDVPENTDAPATSEEPVYTEEPSGTAGPSGSGVNYTVPEEEDLDDMEHCAFEARIIFGTFDDASTLPLDKLMEYYCWVLDWETNMSRRYYYMNDVWVPFDGGDTTKWRFTISAELLGKWFSKRLGVNPDFTGMKDLPVYLGDAFTADYIPGEDKVTITLNREIGEGGSGPEKFRPYYKSGGCEVDGTRYIFNTVYVTKEKPDDMTGVKVAYIREISYGGYGYGYYENAENGDPPTPEEMATVYEDCTVTVTEVYEIPVYAVVTEHVDEEFIIRSIKALR
jgi:hypothetical protein